MKLTAQAWLLVLAPCAVACSTAPKSADWLLQNGVVVDGEGRAARARDVAILDGRIHVLSPGTEVEAVQRLDVSGMVIAPGFIDPHASVDLSLIDPDPSVGARHALEGVTTIVGGEGSPAAIRDQVARFDRHGIPTNVAFYVEHESLDAELGSAASETGRRSEDEIDAMRDQLARGMRLGAVGLSSGMDLAVPGANDELVRLLSEVRRFGGIYDAHPPDPVDDEAESAVFDVGQRARVPVQLRTAAGDPIAMEGVEAISPNRSADDGSLEEDVRVRTSYPADFLGFEDRGRVKDGRIADLVVFPPTDSVDEADVRHVFVAGVPVVLDGEATGRRPGRFVRRSEKTERPRQPTMHDLYGRRTLWCYPFGPGWGFGFGGRGFGPGWGGGWGGGYWFSGGWGWP